MSLENRMKRSLSIGGLAAALVAGCSQGVIGAAGTLPEGLPGASGSSGTMPSGVGSASSSSGGSSSGSSSGAPGVSAGVTVSPSIAHALPSATVTFTATVTGQSSAAVTWSVQEGASGGSVSSTGAYTAPSAAGTYHVVAASQADATKTGTATVIVATVGNCSNLPAAKTWQNISPVVADPNNTSGTNFSEAIVVDPFNPAIVWSGTGYAGLFKSTDCGSTWTHVNTGRNGAMLDQSAIGSMIVDPVNQGTIYATAFDGADGLWKSTNGGVDWDALLPANSTVAMAVTGNLVNSVAMDASDPKHLVIGMHAACNPPYGIVCEGESTDAGATWKVTTVPVGDDNWVPGAGAFILGPKSWLFGTYSNGLWLTQDSGATWKNVTASGAQGSTAGKTLVLPFMPNPVDGKFYLPDMNGILQSTTSAGTSWTLLPNSGGRSVGLVMGDGNLYSSDQWSTSYHVAAEANPSVWATFPAAAALASGLGAPYLAYDAGHHVLYSSNFAGGLWRVTTQ
jgi:hypothetical protein